MSPEIRLLAISSVLFADASAAGGLALDAVLAGKVLGRISVAVALFSGLLAKEKLNRERE